MDQNRFAALSAANPGQELELENLLAQEALVQGLIHARKAAGLSQLAVAQRLDIPVSLVRQVEAGKRDLTLTELREYAYAVDAFIEYEVELEETEEDQATPA